MNLKIEAVKLNWPEGCNIIVGQSHFIKTVEDISEIMASYVPKASYGLAFNEASGPCLIRTDGNDENLLKYAEKCANDVAAGHAFFLIIKECFPINILNQLKNCHEVCHIFCATANPLEILVTESDQGRGIIGVIDGHSPSGIETDKDKNDRYNILRNFKYKH
ncbi:MAG: adenosine-specific kinase [Victivallales bacterium]|nr:adenosine-specific kinase [Victivallales bacterium]